MKVIQKMGVRFPYRPALSVDAKALNNEASAHAYNCELEVRINNTISSQGEKEVHNLRGERMVGILPQKGWGSHKIPCQVRLLTTSPF